MNAMTQRYQENRPLHLTRKIYSKKKRIYIKPRTKRAKFYTSVVIFLNQYTSETLELPAESSYWMKFMVWLIPQYITVFFIKTETTKRMLLYFIRLISQLRLM